MREHSRRVVVKGGLGRPGGTEAQRRPLTTMGTARATIDVAPPTGRGLPSQRPHGVPLIRSYSRTPTPASDGLDGVTTLSVW